MLRLGRLGNRVSNEHGQLRSYLPLRSISRSFLGATGSSSFERYIKYRDRHCQPLSKLPQKRPSYNILPYQAKVSVDSLCKSDHIGVNHPISLSLQEEMASLIPYGYTRVHFEQFADSLSSLYAVPPALHLRLVAINYEHALAHRIALVHNRS